MLLSSCQNNVASLGRESDYNYEICAGGGSRFVACPSKNRGFLDCVCVCIYVFVCIYVYVCVCMCVVCVRVCVCVCM